MTCVVGLEHEGRVYMAGDRAAVHRSRTGMGATSFVWGEPKVFKRAGFLLGFCGSFRIGQLLQHAVSLPAYRGTDEGLTAYLATEFARALQDVLRAEGLNMTERGTGLLIGRRGVLHKMDSDMQVTRVLEGFAAIGMGEPLALGALHALVGFDVLPRRRLLLALGAAERYNVTVRRPFDVLSTRSRRHA